jgi:hypothetical protein
LKTTLGKKFEVKDLGQFSYFFGIEVALESIYLSMLSPLFPSRFGTPLMLLEHPHIVVDPRIDPHQLPQTSLTSFDLEQ